jgi:hypothetical protein
VTRYDSKFSFWAYGILAIAALALILYTSASIGGYSNVGAPLLNLAELIVGAFIIYMFLKLIMRH